MADERPSPRAIAAEIASSCYAMRVRRLDRMITRMYDAEARKHGMTSARINVLVAISTHPGVRAKDLVEPLSIEKSTLSRTLSRLEKDGLIALDGHQIRTTEAGLAKLDAVYDDWRRVQQEATERLGALGEHLLQISAVP